MPLARPFGRLVRHAPDRFGVGWMIGVAAQSSYSFAHASKRCGRSHFSSGEKTQQLQEARSSITDDCLDASERR
jgi:hypothetical protein